MKQMGEKHCKVFTVHKGGNTCIFYVTRINLTIFNKPKNANALLLSISTPLELIHIYREMFIAAL